MLKVQDRKRILLGIVLAGILCIVMVVLTALSAELKQENNRLSSENKALKGEVDTLSVKIKTANNVAHIEDVAMNELGMIYPEEDQCVYITSKDAPKKNFAAVIRQEAYR